MEFSELREELSYIDKMVKEFDRIAPSGVDKNTFVRSDLAGLLLIAICAVYENCIKKIMIEYSDGKHNEFSFFIENNYKRLNSRIRKNDLIKLLEMFSKAKGIGFKSKVKNFSNKVHGVNLGDTYDQLLSWRHDYAHAKVSSTTLEEIHKHHRVGKFVVFYFYFCIHRLQ